MSTHLSKENKEVLCRSQECVFKYRNFCLGPLNFQIHRGDRIAIIGANGSGKTTLLNMLAGLKKPTQGFLKIDASKPHTAFLSDNLFFPSHWELATCVDAYLNMRGMPLLRMEDPLWRKTKFEEGSKGMKVQVLLKAIQAQKPEFLLCDEPSSGLDPLYQQQLLKFLNDYAGTLVMTTHYFSEMQRLPWTQVWFLKSGQMEKISTPSTPQAWEHAFGLI